MYINPEAYQSLFKRSNDPQYLLDLKTQIFLEINSAFEKLTGYKKQELVNKMTAVDLTAPQYLPILAKKMEARRKGLVESERYEFKLRRKSGEIKPVEISIHKIKIGKQDVIVGSIRDTSERVALEHALRDKLTELGHANSRILLLTEKLRHATSLFNRLLNLNSEQMILKETYNLLCSRTGLGYPAAAIYMVKDEFLNLVYPESTRSPTAKIRLTQNHPFTNFIRDKTVFREAGHQLFLAIKGHQQVLGLLQIWLTVTERQLLSGSSVFKKGYIDFLTTLTDSLGLVLENIGLNKELEKLSITDGLTGCYNRRYCEQVLAGEFQRARRYSRKLSLIMIDVDNFKEINDQAGHIQGDLVLKELAQLMARTSRRKLDILCRYGGDEFVLLLPETGRHGAGGKAHLLKQRVKAHRFTNRDQPKHPFSLSISCGVVTMTPRIENSEEFIDIADHALFRAKPHR